MNFIFETCQINIKILILDFTHKYRQWQKIDHVKTSTMTNFKLNIKHTGKPHSLRDLKNLLHQNFNSTERMTASKNLPCRNVDHAKKIDCAETSTISKCRPHRNIDRTDTSIRKHWSHRNIDRTKILTTPKYYHAKTSTMPKYQPRRISLAWGTS